MLFDSIIQTSPKEKGEKGLGLGIWGNPTGMSSKIFVTLLTLYVHRLKVEDAWKIEEEKGFIFFQNHKLLHKWKKNLGYYCTNI